MRDIKCIIAVCIVLFGLSLQAQPLLNSPYSRLGLGELLDPQFAAQRGMGGISAAYQDFYHSNFVNPAAIGFLRSTSFEAGLYGQTVNWEDNSLGTSFSEARGNLTNLSLAFPMRNPLNAAIDGVTYDKFWSMGFSLVPYSSVGYDLALTEEDPQIGSVDYLFEGEGGTYQVTWTNAFRYRNLSVGVNLGYHFGKISFLQQSIPVDQSFYYRNSFSNEFTVNGFFWRAGLQYKYYFDRAGERNIAALRRSPSLTIGVYGNSQSSITTRSNDLFLRLNPFYSAGGFPALDTVFANTELEGSGTLPGTVGFGLLYDNNEGVKVGADLVVSNWSAYEVDVSGKQNERLENTFRVAGGVEWIPDPEAYNKFFQRVRYRLGAYYAEDPRSIQGNQITKYALTFGFGLPIVMRQDVSFVNFGFEIGQLGTEDFLQGTFGQLTLGFTLNDNTWFYKRKFN